MAQKQNVTSEPMSGSIPASTGAPTVLRIPVPNGNGLCIEFYPRQFTGKSTSVLFFQDSTGKAQLRLDYGYNKQTKAYDFHWNQKGTFEQFKIADHTVAGRAGAALYRGAKYYRFAGRVFIVIGAGIDAYSIVVASKPLRQSAKVISGWTAGLYLSGEFAAAGAELGTPGGPIGMAVGGVGAGIAGFWIGYTTASGAAARVYDWAEGTLFTKIPGSSQP